MKKIKSLAVMGIAATAGILASCGGGKTSTTPATPSTTQKAEENAVEKALKNLIFEKDGTVVNDASFTVLKELTVNGKSYPIEWKSDSKLVTYENGKFTCSRPEAAQTKVTITAKVDADGVVGEKTYTIKLNPYSLMDIQRAFSIEQKSGTIIKDFELPQSSTLGNKTAQITWSSSDDSVIKIEGTTAKVTPQDEKTSVTLKAVFTMGEETTNKTFTISVWRERTPDVLFNTFYDKVGFESYNLKGYVVSKGGWAASYLDGVVTILDQTKLGAYYVYYAYVNSQEEWDALTIGTRVEIPACTSTEYNGLLETANSKDHKIRFITDDNELAPLTAEELEALKAGKSVDDLIVLNSTKTSQAKYQTGNNVSLTSWKVKTVNADAEAKDGQVLMTLEKDGATVNVKFTKYLADFTSAEATGAAGAAKAAGIAVGDYVNVKGVLTFNSDYWTITPIVADYVTKLTTNDAGASTAKGKAVREASAALALETSYVAAKELDVKAIETANGVTITTTVTGNGAAFDPETGKLTLTPTSSKGDEVTVTFVVTKDGVSQTLTQTTTLVVKTPAEQVAAEKAALTITPASNVATLASKGATFGDVVITYEVTEGADYATIKDGKLTLGYPDAAQTVKVVATLTYGEATDTKEFTFDLPATTYQTVSEVIAATADLEGKQVFIKGEVIQIDNASTGVFWISDGTNKYEIYRLKDPTQMSQVKLGSIVYLTGTHKKYTPKTGDPIYETNTSTAVVIKTEAPAAEKQVAATISEFAGFAKVQEDTTLTLATEGTNWSDVKVTWDVKEDTKKVAVLTGNSLAITQPTDADATVTLTATFTLGEVVQTKDFVVEVAKASATKTKNLASSDYIANSATVEETNYAEQYGLNPDVFTVKFAKNNANNLAAIGNGTEFATTSSSTSYAVALYNDKNASATEGASFEGSSCTITVAEGYKIDSVTVYYNTNSSYVGSVLSINGTAQAAVATDHTSDTVTFDAETQSVVIQDAGTKQCRFYVVITYTKTAE